ncbi:hypothetical protein F5890DRAFT_1460981 [Lentinula detonsa]|uniref:Armadillo-like helical domain-containing protein n=1 Tax=Lentinula detonsa TaxID=2804962 RepID=A0AA38UTG9_9AGAR|nr:hypothetical protein F5890DRAFT_1460981 [Lentinula detonsa]
MNLPLSTKFNAIYSKLFQGLLPAQIGSSEDTDRFYSDLLDLDVNRAFLEQKLQRLTKEQCYGALKPVFNSLFSSYIYWARNAQSTKATHALETLCILTRSILSKNPTGWEVIEIFSGGAKESDILFMSLTSLVDEHLRNDGTSANNRHLALQLALIFMCGVGQLSPGAYFLRIDMYPSITHFMKSLKQFSFEAALLLSILANFHRSDASELNLYLKRIKTAEDRDIMHKICWATAFALDACVRAYQEASVGDSSTLMPTLGSVFERLHLKRALVESPTVISSKLKNQPIEACVSFLPAYEYLSNNPIFPFVLSESFPLTTNNESRSTSLLFTSLSLSSYLLTHATSSPRSLAYANLSLTWLLLLSANTHIMETLTQPTSVPIHICRQRQPFLPRPSSNQRPICALLDCCVLWLRHNLNKRLEVHSYAHCVWVCQQIICYLAESRIRFDYYWKEFWTSILALLGFLANKLDNLYTTGGVYNLVQETILLLDICLAKGPAFLPSPQALHEFIYELVHGHEVLQKQAGLLQTLELPPSEPIQKAQVGEPSRILTSMLETIGYYEVKIAAAGAISATQAMQIVAREIDRDGLHGVTESRRFVLPKRTNEVFGFVKYGCIDILALMP